MVREKSRLVKIKNIKRKYHLYHGIISAGHLYLGIISAGHLYHGIISAGHLYHGIISAGHLYHGIISGKRCILQDTWYRIQCTHCIHAISNVQDNRIHDYFTCTLDNLNFTLYIVKSYQLKLTKIRAELANLNHCAVPFLSRWYYYTIHKLCNIQSCLQSWANVWNYSA